MQINRVKHVLQSSSRCNMAINDIERLRNKDNSEEFKAILEKAIEWYETDNLNAYVFFKDAFPVHEKCAADFYEGLGSFLVNTLLDDSCFELKWTKYNFNTGEEEITNKHWKEDLTISVGAIWSHDDSPNRSIDPKLMLRAMKYLDNKDIRRQEADKKIKECLFKIRQK